MYLQQIDFKISLWIESYDCLVLLYCWYFYILYTKSNFYFNKSLINRWFHLVLIIGYIKSILCIFVTDYFRTNNFVINHFFIFKKYIMYIHTVNNFISIGEQIIKNKWSTLFWMYCLDYLFYNNHKIIISTLQLSPVFIVFLLLLCK